MKERLKDANKGLTTVPIRGKNYVMVKDRVTAFRQNFDGWAITTELLRLAEGECVVRATVFDEDGQPQATGLAHEKEGSSAINRTSYVENCETSAIGRALACLGIGIDDSFGSADEVASAIEQQERDAPLTSEKLKNLVNLVMIERGSSKEGAIEFIKFLTGKESSKDLTPEDYAKVVKEVRHE